jgi:hypothetical protein
MKAKSKSNKRPQRNNSERRKQYQPGISLAILLFGTSWAGNDWQTV